MAITQSQSNIPGSVNNLAVGKFHDSGTVAATDFTLGFKPRYVLVVNVDAGGYVKEEYFEGMADDSGVLTGSDGAISLITSDGITANADGFTLGLNTDVLATDEQLYWMAIG